MLVPSEPQYTLLFDGAVKIIILNASNIFPNYNKYLFVILFVTYISLSLLQDVQISEFIWIMFSCSSIKSYQVSL